MLSLCINKMFACGTILRNYVTRYCRCWVWSYNIYIVLGQRD